MDEALLHARALAEAVRRVEGLKRELSIAEAQVKSLASDMITIIDVAHAIGEQERMKAETMVRPYVRATASVQAAENKRAGQEVTFGWTPMAEQLTREQRAVQHCETPDCRELYPHFHDSFGIPHSV